MRTDTDTAGHASVDLRELACVSEPRKPAWAYRGDDLNANLVILAPRESLAEYVNTEVDVLIVGVAGSGIIELDGRRHSIMEGHVIIIPKGAHRAIRAGETRFAYLTCHRRRPGLRPGVATPPPARPAVGA